MARVYVSSTQLDLHNERRAVIDWLTAAHHQPCHSYTADNETVRASCVADVRGCDAYVLILGHRYGHVPLDDNPNGWSITELEYEAAVTAGLPVTALSATAIRNTALTDIGKPAYTKVQAFHGKVNKAHRAAEFGNAEALIAVLSTGLLKALSIDPLKDPRVQAIITTLTSKNLNSENEAAALRNENTELKSQLAAAIARQLANASAPGATAAQINATRALQAGDSGPSEALLAKEATATAQQADAQTDPAAQAAGRKEAAALARERGALARHHDVMAALVAYQQATDCDPADVWSWFYLSDLQRFVGDLPNAILSVTRAQAAAQQRLDLDGDDTAARHHLCISQIERGKLFEAQGNLTAAFNACSQAMEIAQALTQRELVNSEWMRSLANSQGLLGDMLIKQGDLRSARLAYQASMSNKADLLKRAPDNNEWRRDLSIGYEKLGKVQQAEGDLLSALRSFRDGMAIAEELAQSDPTNIQWQRDLSICHEWIGTVQNALDDWPAALEAFRESITITRALATGDQANKEWQHDLWTSHHLLGKAFLSRRQWSSARDELSSALAIAKSLALHDPTNARWQHDLSESHENLGDWLLAQSEFAAALVEYRLSRALREALVQRDLTNSRWQESLCTTHQRISAVLQALSDLPAAVTELRKGVVVAKRLERLNSPSGNWQLAIFCVKLVRHLGPKHVERQALLAQSKAALNAWETARRPPPEPNGREWFATQFRELDGPQA